jgi:hypothetical protein
MKMLVIAGVFLVAQAGFAPLRSQSQREAAQAQETTAAHDQPLFLHLLAPQIYADPPIPAHRIVTAKVYPFEDFSVSAGDDENPFAKPWDGAVTNPLWSTNGSPKARPLEPIWNSGDATLAGRIEQVNGSFLAHLQGRDRTTVNWFNGKIELEKPFFEQGSYFHDGRIWPVWFVLSTNFECSGFLKALENGSLRRPNIVDRNSPLVDRWTKDKPKAELGAAPSGGSVGSQDKPDPLDARHR